MLNWVFGNRGKREGQSKRNKPKEKKPDYNAAKRIAEKGDAEARRALAEHEDLEPEILYYFATDESPAVRRQVAENPGTPLQADRILAEDPDEDVRAELALKIGRLVPNLTPDENEKLVDLAMEVLDVLAKDQIPRVRAIIAEEIKHATNLPHELIRRLAEDVEEVVSAPVLEYSPLLSEKDLLQIIARGLKTRALVAVAARHDLQSAVAKAVTDTGNEKAVTRLLENTKGQIDETVLSHIMDVLPASDQWHNAMVQRDNLPERLLKRIASFVSATLLETLIERNQVRPELVDEIRKSVRKRIDKGDVSDPDDDLEPAADRAKKAFEAGKLDDANLEAAIERGDFAYVRHGLALKADLPLAAASRLLNTKGPKAIVALAKKADVGMPLCVVIQRRLGRVKENLIIHPRPDGSHPISDEDVEWFIENAEV